MTIARPRHKADSSFSEFNYKENCSALAGKLTLHIEYYGGSQLSRQSKSLTAKANHSRQKQITHGKSKSLTAKANRSRQKQIRSKQKQIVAHGKNKFTHGKSKLTQNAIFL